MDSSTEPVNKKESSGKRAMRERTKSAAFDPRAIWCAALGGASQELWGDIVRSEAGQLQFQDDRLFNNVWKRIEGKPARVFVSTFRCYEFVTDPARQPGFDEARRLHDEEMKAARTDSAQLFCRTFRRKVMDSSTRGLRELRTGLSSRLCSIASWMEAQHGFGMWLGFRHYRVGWQSDPDTRGRAVHAWILANALRFLHVYEFSGGYTVTGVRLWEAWVWGRTMKASRGIKDSGRTFYAKLQGLQKRDRLIAHHWRIGRGGVIRCSADIGGAHERCRRPRLFEGSGMTLRGKL